MVVRIRSVEAHRAQANAPHVHTGVGSRSFVPLYGERHWHGTIFMIDTKHCVFVVMSLINTLRRLSMADSPALAGVLDYILTIRPCNISVL